MRKNLKKSFLEMGIDKHSKLESDSNVEEDGNESWNLDTSV